MLNFKKKNEEDIFFNPDEEKKTVDKEDNEEIVAGLLNISKILGVLVVGISGILFTVSFSHFVTTGEFLKMDKSEVSASKEKEESVEELIPLTDIQYLSNNYVSTGRGTRKEDKKFVLYFTKKFGEEITTDDYYDMRSKYDIDPKISIYRNSPDDVLFEKDNSVADGNMIAVFKRTDIVDSKGFVAETSRELKKVLVPSTFDLNNHIIDPVIKTFQD